MIEVSSSQKATNDLNLQLNQNILGGIFSTFFLLPVKEAVYDKAW